VKGNTIWSVCILTSVPSLINSEPHNQYTRNSPQIGTVESILLNTVRPQYDIWVNGSTYPMKAIKIQSMKIKTPIIITMGLESNISKYQNTLIICAKSRK